MARYLVTGAAGFIAARVCEMLLEQGDEVIGVDNLCTAYDVRLKHYRLNRLLPHENFTFHGMDISDRRGVDALVGACAPLDGIINLAARAGVRASVEDPWVFVETNVTGTLNLLEAARRHGVSKFILSSTAFTAKTPPCPPPKTPPATVRSSPIPPARKAPKPCVTPTTSCTGWT